MKKQRKPPLEMAPRYITVHKGRAFRGDDPSKGYQAMVDCVGDVLVLDEVAGHYTNCHCLTRDQRAYVHQYAIPRQALESKDQ